MSASIHNNSYKSEVPLPFLQRSIANAILSAALRTLPSILDLTLHDLGYIGASDSHGLAFQNELAAQLSIPLEQSWAPQTSIRDLVQALSAPVVSKAEQRPSSQSPLSDLIEPPNTKPTSSERDSVIIDSYVSKFVTVVSSAEPASCLLSAPYPTDSRHLLLAGPNEPLVCALLERLTRRPFPSELETITVLTLGDSNEEAYARLVGSLGSRGYNVPAIMGGIDQVDVQVIGCKGSDLENLGAKDKKRLEGGIDTLIICGSESSGEDSIESILSIWKLCLSKRHKNFYFVSPGSRPFDFVEPVRFPLSPSDVTSGLLEATSGLKNISMSERIVRTISTRFLLSSTIFPLPPLLPHLQHGTWSRSNPLGKILKAGYQARSLPDIPLNVRIPWISLNQAASWMIHQIFFTPSKEASNIQPPELEVLKMGYIEWASLLNILKSSTYPSFQILPRTDWVSFVQTKTRSAEDAGMWLREVQDWTKEQGEWRELNEKGEEESLAVSTVDRWVQNWKDTIFD